MLAGLAVYTGWILVSVWRCAENIAGRPFNLEPGLWTWLARWLTVAWAINVAALNSVGSDELAGLAARISFAK